MCRYSLIFRMSTNNTAVLVKRKNKVINTTCIFIIKVRIGSNVQNMFKW